MKDRQFFARHPVFTHAEYLAAGTGLRRTSPRTADSQLRYHLGAGNLLRIRRGLFAVVPPGLTLAPADVSPFLVAGRLTPDAVVAYYGALQYHGYAHTSRLEYQFLTKQPCRPFRFGPCSYLATAFPKALRTAGQEGFGVLETRSEGAAIRVTSVERTFVDVLDRPELIGDWKELWLSLERIRALKIDQVVTYASLLGSASVMAKVGLFLDLHREELRVGDDVLEHLQARRPSSLQYVVGRELRAKIPGRLVRRWNLIVPSAILERTWDDPG